MKVLLHGCGEENSKLKRCIKNMTKTAVVIVVG